MLRYQAATKQTGDILHPFGFEDKAPTTKTRPAGITDGIFYDSADPTKVTVSLYVAPSKSGVTAKNVKVVATASPEGTAEYNKRLSEKRAAVVCDYLTKKGVNVVSAEGLGVKGDASGRVAIVTVE